MQYIIDPNEAVVCQKVTRPQQPCLNVYCKQCVVNFIDEIHHFEINDSSDN
jgi:hypothetical protein